MDEATNLQAKVSGVGVVLRDTQGNFVAAGTWFLPTISSVFHAEIHAILHGVELASHLGFQKVRIKSDSS